MYDIHGDSFAVALIKVGETEKIFKNNYKFFKILLGIIIIQTIVDTTITFYYFFKNWEDYASCRLIRDPTGATALAFIQDIFTFYILFILFISSFWKSSFYEQEPIDLIELDSNFTEKIEEESRTSSNVISNITF